MGVLMTPLLGSCSTDDVIGGAGREECDIISGQPMTVTSATRATDGSQSSTQFEQDEIVWLWANKTNDTEYITAWKLKADGNGGFSSATTGADKYWPSDGSKLNVYALHGNFTESDLNKNWSDLTSLKHKVLTDQSFDDNRRQSDLLLAEKTNVTHGTTVDLSFEHLLAKITVKLDLLHSTGITNSDFATNAKVELLSILPEAYFVSSSITAPTSGGTSIDINAGTITQPDNLSSDSYLAGSAIVPIQTFAANKELIQITLGSRTFKYKVESEITLEKGKEYTYTLQIRGEYVKGSLSVSDFTTSTVNQKFTDYIDYLADLKNRAYLGSADDPHDLSYDYNGQMNTANCYVVTHPGYYKFPLVYGNAIKNGATNAIAYGVKDGTSISSTFVNHLGNKITDPYIYNNSNNNSGKLEANSAALVWQDAPNLISNNIDLCDGNTYISFEITKENIQQGNAVIAVKDGSDNIMWSWHIWVTNKNVYETQAVTASYNSTNKTLMFMPFPLGWNDSTTAPTCTFYQWGRKDPFPPSNGSSLTSTIDKTVYKYDPNGNSTTSDCWSQSSSQATIATSILNPSTFYFGYANWCSQSSYELWNVGEDDHNVDFETITKSVYDPSPAGFRLPETAAFTGFTVNGVNEGTPNGTWNDTTKGYTFTNGVETYWQACGYREYNSGSLNDVGSWGYYWSAGPSRTTDGRHLNIYSSKVNPQSNFKRAYGVSVRPVSE